MAELVVNPYPVFKDIDGTALEDGFIFIGVAGQDPEDFPQDAFWDLALTDPATNIRTKSGYPFNSTFPGTLYTADPFSIKVKNKREELIYAVKDSFVLTITDADTVDGLHANDNTITDDDTTLSTKNKVKAYADTKVSLTGNESVAGVKTFSSIPVLPASDPTTDNQAARKAYVDPKITGSTDQIAKAWVNFNGTGTVAIRDSFNVSSITDVNTGTYEINYTNNLNNSNYCVNFSASTKAVVRSDVFSVSKVQVRTYVLDSTALQDADLGNVSIFVS